MNTVHSQQESLSTPIRSAFKTEISSMTNNQTIAFQSLASLRSRQTSCSLADTGSLLSEGKRGRLASVRSSDEKNKLNVGYKCKTNYILNRLDKLSNQLSKIEADIFLFSCEPNDLINFIKEFSNLVTEVIKLNSKQHQILEIISLSHFSYTKNIHYQNKSKSNSLAWSDEASLPHPLCPDRREDEGMKNPDNSYLLINLMNLHIITKVMLIYQQYLYLNNNWIYSEMKNQQAIQLKSKRIGLTPLALLSEGKRGRLAKEGNKQHEFGTINRTIYWLSKCLLISNTILSIFDRLSYYYSQINEYVRLQ